MPRIRKQCENTVSPVPSFRAKARNLFRLRSRRNRRASENGKRRTPYALRSRRFIRAGKSERLTKKRPRLCLGGRYKKMLLIHSFLFRCVSQPPPLRGTSFHRKEGEPHPRAKAFPAWEGSDARIPLSHTVISSESEKSFSFAVKKKRESIGKRETRYSIRSGITSFHSGIKNPLKQFGDLPCLL